MYNLSLPNCLHTYYFFIKRTAKFPKASDFRVIGNTEWEFLVDIYKNMLEKININQEENNSNDSNDIQQENL